MTESIRGGAGLGDALYVQSVARHLVETGYQVEVCTAWPDVLRPLWGRVSFSPFRRDRITRLAHYSMRRFTIGTTQFEDICLSAGVPKDIDLRLDWVPANLDLIRSLQASGRPILVVQMPRAPFARSDGFGKEFLPDCRRIQHAIDMVGDRACKVLVGSGEATFCYSGIDIDLTNRTSVPDLIDVGYAADAFLGQCSFIVPLAEGFRKPALLVWSRAGLQSAQPVIRSMTPIKILHRPSSFAIVDDCSGVEMQQAVDALCVQVGRSLAA